MRSILFVAAIASSSCVADQSPDNTSHQSSALIGDPDPEPEPGPKSGPIVPAPSNLHLKTNGYSTITLEFNCGGNAENHESQRSLNAGATWTKVEDHECGGSVGVVWDNYVQPETAYCYRVKATNSTNTAYSNTLCVTSLIDTRPLTAPAIKVTNQQLGAITVQFEDKSINESGFRLYRRLQGAAGWTQIYEKLRGMKAHGSVGEKITFTDAGLTSSQRYEYKVRAFNPWKTADSPVVTGFSAPKPTAPSNLHMISKTAHSVTLGWTDNSSNEDEFIVWRRLPGEEWATGTTFSMNATSGTITGLTEGCDYRFSVGAYNGAGGNTTSEIVVTPEAPPDPGPYADTIIMNAQPVWSGYRPYTASYGSSNMELVSLQLPSFAGAQIALGFVRPGHTTEDCGDDEAVVLLAEGETLTGAELADLYGSSTPDFPINFVACLYSDQPGLIIDQVWLNLTWQYR